LLTAVLLFAQFSILRSRALLAIASGYLYTALIVIQQASRQPRTIRSRAPPLHAPPDGRGAKSVADLVRMANVLGVKPEH